MVYIKVMEDTTEIQNPIPSEFTDKVPATEQRGKVRFLKADIVSEDFKRIEQPTEGQVVMAMMMVDLPKEELKTASHKELETKARPAGYAIGFAKEPVVHGENLGKNLLDSGMIMFTSTVESNGKTSFVGVDKDGVFLVQEGPKKTEDEFLQSMRTRLDSVGDQEDNFVVNTDSSEQANARHWGSEFVTIVSLAEENAANALKLASEESLKAPFISSKDAERMKPKATTSEEPQPAPVKLDEVSF